MRILKFAWVDYLKCRRMGFILILFPVLAVVMVTMSQKMPTLFAVSYCLFAGIIFSTYAFSMESRDERGFLQMLPSRPGEILLGHFLFGLLTTVLSFLLGMAALGAARLLVPGQEIFTAGGVSVAGLYPALLAAALVFVGLQDVMLTFLRYEKANLLQLIRIVPAFVFFFLFNSAIDEKKAMIGPFGLLPGLGVLAGALALFALLALLARAVAIRKGD